MLIIYFLRISSNIIEFIYIQGMVSILSIILIVVILIGYILQFVIEYMYTPHTHRIGSNESRTYTYHRYTDTNRKYSKAIEELLKQDTRFIEEDGIVDWSDKNSMSRVKDYYPFPKKSLIDKKYLPILFPKLVPSTYTKGDFNKFIENDSKQLNKVVYFLKPADKYIGGSNGIEISLDPYSLHKKFVEDKFVIQKEIDPMLINGYKFDIRSYVLIVYNKKYIHIYYHYGIIRYCKEKYEQNTIDHDKQITIHGNYEYVTDNEILTPYLNDIKNIIFNTLLRLRVPNELGYQYLGYDIMISKSGRPYLIEVNIQPSFERVRYNINILNDFVKLVIEPVLTNDKGYRPFMSISNNIVLAEPNMQYLHDLYNITKNISIMQYIGNLQKWSFEKTKRFIEYGPSENYYYKMILYKNELSGIIGIYKNKTDYYNLTIFLGQNYIGKKIGYEALSLFLLTIDSSPIFADVLSTNERSIRFFKQQGYSYENIGNIYRFIIKNN